MCGIAGIARREPMGVPVDVLQSMAASLRHRGPDGYGLFTGRRVAFAHTRLSIIDIDGGAQPLTNEDGSIIVVYNGEIYNHVELRRELGLQGHRFHTRCDTEVLVHGWEEWGEDLFDHLNGQFAFALYDRRREWVILARDRFGVRPLFYSENRGDLVFGSEVKAVLASGFVQGTPDMRGLDEVFTFWGARAPRTPFKGIRQLEPGTYAIWRDGKLDVRSYYEIDYPEAEREPDTAMDRLDGLMRSGIGLRMRADVPVGGYLSGGLDSSITCAVAAGMSPHDLRTFSVAFQQPEFDESGFQRQLAEALGSVHAVKAIRSGDIGRVFPNVVNHAETPLVRTAPAPLFLLSRLTRDAGIKVVLTGEGADELFLGYDLFKETAVRHFCLRQPQSTRRRQLFRRLYPYLDSGGRVGEFWSNFFLQAGPVDDPLFSHLPRFLLTSRIKDFYSADMKVELQGFDAMEELRDRLPKRFHDWTVLGKAAYLEMTTLLPSYLLSSQGDRMAMAHSIEGRFPFLDHRLFEFTAGLPSRSKLRVLREKDILRRWAAGVVPANLAARPKQPYRAPDIPAFLDDPINWYVDQLLAPDAIRETGIFDERAVSGLMRRCRAGKATGFRENQAFVAILSTQLWHRQFIRSSHTVEPMRTTPTLHLDETRMSNAMPAYSVPATQA